MSKIIITKKDQEIINTVKNLKVMTSTQIERLFFYHKQNQNRRCKQLVNHKKLKCFRNGFGEEMIYYYKKKPTQQLKSMLIVSQFYVNLIELGNKLGYTVKQFTREYPVVVSSGFTIRPDAYFIVVKNSIEYEYFLEIDNTHEFDGMKYYKAKKLGYITPTVISVSNKKRVTYYEMDLLKLKLDLSDFEDIIGSYLS